MREIVVLLGHLLARLATLLGSRGARAVLAENLILKHQLLIIQRSRHRAPNLRPADRVLLGCLSRFLDRRRLLRAAVILKPATLLRFHRVLRDLKYRCLYSSQPKRKPGPKGPSLELIQAICELKRRNPRFGCPKIAQLLAKAFGVEINRDVVRRVLARHYRPARGQSGPSWLTLLGHSKDSLWSLDLFRTESILLKTHWILVVMDQFSRLCMANCYFKLQRTDLVALLLPQAVGGEMPESACPPLEAKVGFHPSPNGRKQANNEGLNSV